MSLLNRLFGSDRSLGREIARDEAERLAAFQRFLDNVPKLEELAKSFAGKNRDVLLQDPARTEAVMREASSLLSQDLVAVGTQIKDDDEIIKDLHAIAWNGAELQELLPILREEIESESRRYNAALDTFRRLYRELDAASCAVRRVPELARTNPKKAGEMLEYLHGIFNYDLPVISYRFGTEHVKPKVQDQLKHIVHAILIEEDLERRVLSAEEKFVIEALRKMANPESRTTYRKMGEKIYHDLAERAGAPAGEQMFEAMARQKQLASDDAVLRAAVRKACPKYDDVKIGYMMAAFRRAFNDAYFTDMEEIFYK